MKLSIKALAIASAVIWGGAMLITGLANMMWPDYGKAFLDIMASVYPGYSANGGIGQVVNGTLYAAVDGLIGGAIFAWIYNFFAQD